MKIVTCAAVLAVGAILAACSNASVPPSSATSEGQSGRSAGAQSLSEPKRSTPIVAGRPARVFIMAGFDDACQALKPEIALVRKPAKGAVTFKPGQSTTIKASKSGKCIGSRVVGTGIYYTADAGQLGADTFSVTVKVGQDAPVTRVFNVTISE